MRPLSINSLRSDTGAGSSPFAGTRRIACQFWRHRHEGRFPDLRRGSIATAAIGDTCRSRARKYTFSGSRSPQPCAVSCAHSLLPGCRPHCHSCPATAVAYRVRHRGQYWNQIAPIGFWSERRFVGGRTVPWRLPTHGSPSTLRPAKASGPHFGRSLEPSVMQTLGTEVPRGKHCHKDGYVGGCFAEMAKLSFIIRGKWRSR